MFIRVIWISRVYIYWGVFQNSSHFTLSQNSESQQMSRSHIATPMMVLYRKWENDLGAKRYYWKTNFGRKLCKVVVRKGLNFLATVIERTPPPPPLLIPHTIHGIIFVTVSHWIIKYKAVSSYFISWVLCFDVQNHLVIGYVNKRHRTWVPDLMFLSHTGSILTFVWLIFVYDNFAHLCR